MAGFNHCVFVGRVGIDPQLNQTNEGVSYCRFRLAVDQAKEEPMWLSVVAWRNLATQVEKFVKKGSLVLVSGRLSVDTYTDKQNRKQTGRGDRRLGCALSGSKAQGRQVAGDRAKYRDSYRRAGSLSDRPDAERAEQGRGVRASPLCYGFSDSTVSNQCSRTGIVLIISALRRFLRLSYSFLVLFYLPVRYKDCVTQPMNMNATQSEQIILPAQSEPPTAPQPLRGVRQDNPAPPRERAASPQPAPRKTVMRTRTMKRKIPRSQKQYSSKRRTVAVTFWMSPGERAALQRAAEVKGLSISQTGRAFVVHMLQENLETQQGALLETIIDKSIGKHMRSYSNRLAVLLVRSLFASEQARSYAINTLARLPGMTESQLNEIKDGAADTARASITRLTPQLKSLIEAVQQWLETVEKEVDGSG